jgi:Rieske Fe-S protein
MNRRELLQSSLFLALPRSCCELSALPPGSFRREASSIIVDLRRALDLNGNGGAVRLLDPEAKVNLIVARLGKNRFLAWSGVCTHGGAPLAYNHRHGTALCSSVGHSEFDADGQVVRGPAPRPIPVYRTHRAGDELFIHLEA